MPRMRKLLAIVVVLLGCLGLVGQAAASVSAGYSDCCLQGCKGMSQCASAVCQACAAPQSAPPPAVSFTWAVEEPRWQLHQPEFEAGLAREPWTPPD